MTSPPPTVYIFHGEDEFGIATELDRLKARLGEEHTIDLDFTVLEPGTYSLDDLHRIVLTIPFLTNRRLVVANNPLKQFSDGKNREKFRGILVSVPEKTALVIVETSSLNHTHWLMQWSKSRAGKVYVQQFGLEAGRNMSSWIRQRARSQGGEFSPEAADGLAEIVGPHKRHAAHEVDKLLAYAAYQRAVEVEDLRMLSIGVEDEAVSRVFEMVDTLGGRKPREALSMLHELLQVYDPVYLFHMIVRQFRFLLLAREAFNDGLGGADLAKQLEVPPWIASKILSQVRNFDQETLEQIYRQLLELDQAVKSSQSDYALGLDTLIAGLSPHPASR